MNNLSERDELLEAVKGPARKKKPSNFSLYAAIVFANLIFVILDGISGFTVYWMTNIPMYGVLTFLAGAVPLLLHESLYVRAYASIDQKKVAVIGAVSALLSIIIIGVLAGIVNIRGVEIQAGTMEVLLIGALVVISAYHAILAAGYFYIDEGIQMHQKTEQAVARALSQGRQIDAGDYILTLTEKSVAKRKKIGAGERAAALQEILRQLGNDDDGDGIPNAIDPDWKGLSQRSYAADTSHADPTAGRENHR